MGGSLQKPFAQLFTIGNSSLPWLKFCCSAPRLGRELSIQAFETNLGNFEITLCFVFISPYKPKNENLALHIWIQPGYIFSLNFLILSRWIKTKWVQSLTVNFLDGSHSLNVKPSSSASTASAWKQWSLCGGLICPLLSHSCSSF